MIDMDDEREILGDKRFVRIDGVLYKCDSYEHYTAKSNKIKRELAEDAERNFANRLMLYEPNKYIEYLKQRKMSDKDE